MAGVQGSDRLQPSLLDRLVDDDPTSAVESRERRVLSLEDLRRSVLRDLTWLLNTTDLESCGVDLSNSEHTRSSVLNYGVRDFAGSNASSVDAAEVEQVVRQAILRFEPRILPDTLEVRVLDGAAVGGSPNAVTFEIQGTLWADPVEEQLFLKTKVDLESGDISVDLA